MLSKIKYKKTYAIILLLCVMSFLWVSKDMLGAISQGYSIEGTIVESTTTRVNNPSSASRSTSSRSSGPYQSLLNEITVKYIVADKTYKKTINAHVLSYLGHFSIDNKVTVFFDPKNPTDADVLDYGVYSPATFIITYIVIAIVLCVFIQYMRVCFTK